jgi:hypothetical protein
MHIVACILPRIRIMQTYIGKETSLGSSELAVECLAVRHGPWSMLILILLTNILLVSET